MMRIACLLFVLPFASVSFAQVSAITSPTDGSTAQPNLIRGADGTLYLTWIRTDDKRATLMFSRWTGEAWARPGTVASGEDWFVNWADFPSMAVLADGTMAAHWLQKSGPGTYSYDVKISLSRDGGKTWSEPASPHRDGTPTEHGFVSLLPQGSDSFGVFWLDGRAMEKGGDMSLRQTTLSRDGTFGDELLVDARVCECCQTSAVVLDQKSFMVAYRDRLDDERRDISLAVVRGGRISRSFSINRDGWVIEGCPVNGPAIARNGNTVAVAWPTTIDERAVVRLRISTDQGRTWGRVIRVDDGNPIGRVDVVVTGEGRAAVSWVEGRPRGSVQSKAFRADGRVLWSRTVARTSEARASGFPQLEQLDDWLFAAWTDVGEGTRVRTARFRNTPPGK